MVGEVLAGLGALKTAFDLAKGLKDIDDTAKRNAAVIDLQQIILDAQAAQQVVLKRSELLEKRVEELESWESERKLYVRRPAAPNVFTYVSQDESINDEGCTPQLCPSCFHDRHKSFLNGETWNPGRCDMIICRDCGWFAYLVGSAEPEHQKLAPKPYRKS